MIGNGVLTTGQQQRLLCQLLQRLIQFGLGTQFLGLQTPRPLYSLSRQLQQLAFMLQRFDIGLLAYLLAVELCLQFGHFRLRTLQTRQKITWIE